MQSDDERFVAQVADLREQWSETRQAAAMGTRYDRASQFKVFTMIYLWCAEIVDQIRLVYGLELAVDQTPMPGEADERPEFAALIGQGYALFVSLASARDAGDRWHVAIALKSPGHGQPIDAGHGRRNPYWTRSRIQDLFLGMLSSIERARLNEVAAYDGGRASLGRANGQLARP